ncbi:AAA family ATPase, partial [Crocosphaera chwakensis]
SYLNEMVTKEDGGILYLAGKPTNYPLKDYCLATNDICAEMDDGTIDQQKKRIKLFVEKTGLIPAIIIFSGNKSLHIHLKGDHNFAIDDAIYLRRLVAICLLSDPAVARPHQPIRLAGFWRKETGKYQELMAYFDQGYSLEEFLLGISKYWEFLGYGDLVDKTELDSLWSFIHPVLVNSDKSLTYEQQKEKLTQIFLDKDQKLVNYQHKQERIKTSIKYENDTYSNKDSKLDSFINSVLYPKLEDTIFQDIGYFGTDYIYHCPLCKEPEPLDNPTLGINRYYFNCFACLRSGTWLKYYWFKTYGDQKFDFMKALQESSELVDLSIELQEVINEENIMKLGNITEKNEQLKSLLASYETETDPMNRRVLVAFIKTNYMESHDLRNEKDINDLILEINQDQQHTNDNKLPNLYEILCKEEEAENPMKEWLVDGLFQEGLTIIAGYSGTGKTSVTDNIAIAVASGQDWNNKAVKQGNVLLLQSELNPTNMKLHFSHLINTDNAESILKNIIPVFDWDFKQMDRLEKLASNHQPVLIIIDSLRSCSIPLSIDENHPKIGVPLYRLKKLSNQLNCSIMVIHHCNKSDPNVFSGSNAIQGAPDTLAILSGTIGQKQELYFQKHRAGIKYQCKKHNIQFNQSTNEWEYLGVKDEDTSKIKNDDDNPVIKKDPPQLILEFLENDYKSSSCVKPFYMKDLSKTLFDVILYPLICAIAAAVLAPKPYEIARLAGIVTDKVTKPPKPVINPVLAA